MGVRKLDTDRYYALVYGDAANNPERPRKYLQDGLFFDGMGVAIDASSEPEAPVEPVAEPPVVVERDDSKADILKELQGLHITKIKALAEKVAVQTGESMPAGGRGAKARMISFIAEHTE